MIIVEIDFCNRRQGRERERERKKHRNKIKCGTYISAHDPIDDCEEVGQVALGLEMMYVVIKCINDATFV